MVMLIAKIRSNDISIREITLIGCASYYCNSVCDLEQAFEKNDVIEMIRCGHEFLESLDSKNEVDCFVESIGRLKNIKNIKIDSAVKVSIGSLAKMVEKATHLVGLSIKRVQLVGSADDFLNLQKALWTHVYLEIFDLFQFTAEVEEDICMGDLFRALGSTRSQLSSIRFVPKHAGVISLSSASIMSVLKLQTLRQLDISNCHLENVHFKTIAWALPKSKVEVLGLCRTNVTDTNATILAPLVTFLQELDLSANPMSDEGCIAIAGALQKENACLRHLDLSGCKSIGIDGFTALAAALAGGNSALEQLGVSAAPDVVRGLPACIVLRNSAAGTAA